MSSPAHRSLGRKEKQRSIDTRKTIMETVLAEFAEKGFDGASIREIAARVNLPHTTVTHHYRTKDLLWQVVAEDLFTTISNLWESDTEAVQSLDAFDWLTNEYVSFLKFAIDHPLFHQFLAREKRRGIRVCRGLQRTFWRRCCNICFQRFEPPSKRDASRWAILS